MRLFLSYVAATVVGLALGAMPFVRYGYGGAHAHDAGPHMDHGARHGGNLLMLRDYHLEIVEREDEVELYLSDERRRPLKPSSCMVSFGDESPTECDWRSYRSVVLRPSSAQTGLYRLTVDEAQPLVVRYP